MKSVPRSGENLVLAYIKSNPICRKAEINPMFLVNEEKLQILGYF